MPVRDTASEGLTHTQSETVKACVTCGAEVPPRFGYFTRRKYCSDGCSRAANDKRARLKRQAGLVAGELYGKPLWVVIFSRYKTNALKRGLSFVLSHDDFLSLWKKPCTYCGDAIETIGIDRIDSSLGYSVDNITPCCTRCNLSKRAASVEDFVTMCRKVASRYAE